MRVGHALDEGGEQFITFKTCTEDHRQQNTEGEEEQIGWDKGDTIGKIEYYIGDKHIGNVDIITCEKIEKASYFNTLKKLFIKYLL